MFLGFNKLRLKPDLLFVFALFFLIFFISYKNYTPGTFLTGVDNFHIEYNLPLALKRAVNAVWQDFQGLGLVGGLAHASDFPRILLYIPLKLILPLSFIRYFYVFLCLFLGPLGVYFLFKYVSRSGVGAVGASLFYLFNLATVQTFFMPTEMFTTHFAFLPWLFLSVLKFLDSGKKKDLAVFGIITFISSPQAMTPTLFFAYVSGLLLILTISLCRRAFYLRGIPNLKKELSVLATVLVVNAYWLLPFGYFALTGSKTVIDSKINQVFSEESFLRGWKYGTLENVALLKGVWFEFSDYSPQRGNHPLMEPWIQHLNVNSTALYLGYILFCFTVLGLVFAFIYKFKHRFEFTLILVLSAFMLINENPPSGFIFSFLRENSALFREALRFPFTKFSTLASLCYSVMFGYFLLFSRSYLSRLRFPFLKYLPTGLLGVGLLYFCLPMFRGNLISTGVRTHVPDEYFELFTYMKTRDTDARVMNLPQYKYINWDYTSWGYRGSGFLWYGIPQPVMDRSFDPWSSNNEAYYYELSYAIYSQDSSKFINVIKKYNIKYIVHDTNIIHTEDSKVLANDYLGTLLRSSNEFVFERRFGGIYLYRVQEGATSELGNNEKNSYSLNEKPYLYSYFDPVFENIGNYFTSRKLGTRRFPFASLFGGDIPKIVRNESGNSFLVEEGNYPIEGTSLLIPDLALKEKSVPISLRDGKIYYNLPLVQVGDKSLNADGVEVQIPYNNEPISINNRFVVQEPASLYTYRDNIITVYNSASRLFSLNISEELASSTIERCEIGESGLSYAKYVENGEIVLTAEDSVACTQTQITKPLPRNFLLRVEFDYLPQASENPRVCVQQEGSFDCINRGAAEKHLEGNWVNYQTFIPVTNQLTNPLWVGLGLDAKGFGSERSIKYRNVWVIAYPVSKEFVYSNNQVIKDLEGAYESHIVKGTDKVSVTIPEHWGYFAEVVGSEFTSPNCPRFNSSINKEYKSLNVSFKDSSCVLSHIFSDDVWAGGLMLDLEYNFTQPVKGVDICLASTETGNCDIKQILKGSYFFRPYMLRSGNTSIHLANNAVGKREVNYVLDRVTLSQFPVDWLMSFQLVDKDNQPSLGRYDVVTNNQAYEGGWVAWCGYTPCKAEHVLVNNWENGWVFDSPTSNSSVTFLYWPRILEYVGFLILIGGLVATVLPVVGMPNITRRGRNINPNP